jgi:hypothetical protein
VGPGVAALEILLASRVTLSMYSSTSICGAQKLLGHALPVVLGAVFGVLHGRMVQSRT